MAIHVVDHFEAIDIDEQHRRWPVGVDIQRLLNVIEKPSAVQDPGQWIPFRQVGQFLILKFQVTLGFAYFSEGR